jgi:hypothetical protein
VIGELRRAFYGARFGNGFPPLVHCGVPLWAPEGGGAIGPDLDMPPNTDTIKSCASLLDTRSDGLSGAGRGLPIRV